MSLFKKGMRAAKDKQYTRAADYLKNALTETADQQLKLAIAEQLIEVYRAQKLYQLINEQLSFVALNSGDRNRRLKAKQELADNYFFKTKSYQEAITHYSHLLEVAYNTNYNHYMIARSYYYLNNTKQAKFEVEQLLKAGLNHELRFEALLLRANLWFAEKNYQQAAMAYEELQQNFPKLAKKSYVLLHLAMSFEESGQYSKAIEKLTLLKDDYHSPEFITSKINHLQNKIHFLPDHQRLKK